MRGEDVPEEWVEIAILEISNWGRREEGLPTIKSSNETCFADDFRARIASTIAAVAPLIAKAERERQAVALVDIAKTYREMAACPDWTRKVRDGHKAAAEAFEGRAAAIRALPDE